MDRTLATIALASFALAAQAGDAVDVSAKSRTQAVASALPVRMADAPFREARDPFPDLFKREVAPLRAQANACDRPGAALCYDLGERRVVYRAARGYMPRIEGLTAESVSLRHDRLVLKYSFR